MRYILTQENQEIFLRKFFYEADCPIEIIEMVEGCKYFYFKIFGNSYFLAKDLKRQTVRNKPSEDYLNAVFKLIEESDFHLQEFDSDFVNFFLQSYSSPQNSLDTDLYEIYNSYLSRYE